MCGIAGIWNSVAADPAARLEVMLRAVAHRGPDGRGALEFAGGAGGMVRLALVDLSDHGQQPIWSPDRKVAILFNGEMYNFREHRARLAAGGYRFTSATDTEVVLALYLEQGQQFVDALRGMYALAIFDWRHSAAGQLPELVLARDPLGIKPLYITSLPQEPSGLAFASELRALRAAELASNDIDPLAVRDYLALGCVVQPRTMLAGVRMLEPGTIEHYAPGRDASQHRFWTIPPAEPRDESLEEAAERLRGVLHNSIGLHALADARVGAFLSGGVDSAGVAAMMRPHISDLRTYTLRFPDVPSGDEAQEAMDIAARLGCHHTTVDIEAADVPSLLERFAADIDQPSIDGFNTWLVSRAAAADCKAVLSGLGGDEWFAGYPVARRMARYAHGLRGQGIRWSGSVAHAVGAFLPAGRLRKRVQNLATRRSLVATWMQSRSVIPFAAAGRAAGLAADQCTGQAELALLQQSVPESWSGETPLGLACLLDVRVYMRNQLLRDSDAASMAHSLELRVPLVDVQLASFARSCHDRWKLAPAGGGDLRYESSGAKQVLIAALGDLLPPQLKSRPKRGFALPFEHWMRTEIRQLVHDTCDPRTIARRGLIDPDALRPVVGSPDSLERHLFPHAWSLMQLELWCRATLDEPRPAVAA